MSATFDAIVSQLVESLGWRPGNRGENRVMRALHALGVSPADVHQQFRIGRWRLDFAWPEVRVCLEADGWVHTTAEVKRKDRLRDQELRAWGWAVHRVDIDSEDAERRIAEVVDFVKYLKYGRAGRRSASDA